MVRLFFCASLSRALSKSRGGICSSTMPMQCLCNARYKGTREVCFRMLVEACSHWDYVVVATLCGLARPQKGLGHIIPPMLCKHFAVHPCSCAYVLGATHHETRVHSLNCKIARTLRTHVHAHTDTHTHTHKCNTRAHAHTCRRKKRKPATRVRE